MSSLEGRTSTYVHYSSRSCSYTTWRNLHHSHHHPYHHGRKKKDYILEEFKITKLPTFHGDMKKYEDVEAWMLGPWNFFKIYDYSETMKVKISTYNVKGKTNIWSEDLKNIRGIVEEELTWSEYDNLFRNEYLSKKYDGKRAKEFYEIKMEQR